MSPDFTVTYNSVHSEARSWSIPSEDPYEEATQQLLEQAPCSPEYVPDPIELEDHVPLHILEYPEDLVPGEDEAPVEAYILEDASAPTPPLPPSFLSPRTPPLLPIPLPVPSTSRRAKIPEADTLPRKRLLLTAPRPGRMMTVLEMVNMREDRAAVRAEIEKKMAQKRTTRSTADQETTNTTSVNNAKLQAMIDQGVATSLAARDALRSTNDDDSHNSGTGDSGFELTRFLDADYAGCKETFKSTSGGAQFLVEKL
nr:hypothetical protein [Tanacetum cinerariifolium]